MTKAWTPYQRTKYFTMLVEAMCLTSQQNVSIVVERRIFFKLHQSYILPNIIIDHLDAKIQRSYSLISNYKL